MEVRDLYGFVLAIVLIGMILGVGMIILSNFSTSSGVSGAASTAINNTITAMAPIASTWMGLIVTIAVLAIILRLVIGSFGGAAR